ncbi:MAG: oxidoreductase [Thalassolituus sp.]|jgi:uncharacterized protein (DUF934 family)|uniref:DUF934 domain-containing protein n=1 Tax=Thalassolituus sp. TaxID=2030822 RepID=UPI00243FE83B|nr:DUF934 domain-containing protein [Pseudomonadota bacterium]MEC8104528.1 DUF934 domain-containing protein [Pseudomonadota bacterium]MEC8443231.1 DUF934 domain-containing protein [Pseudomonadota bacterium]MEC8524560.1 DUF934 domain-containing protein [Pseudomonadota bacterium]TNC87287.1 MAG: oxidoreductase [Thalassolituus sp.]
MPTLINTQGVVEDTALTPVTLKEWQANPSEYAGKELELSVNSDETVDLFGADADQFKRICIDFPKFADGRGYSAARLLREKYGYKGELRSTGDVLIDQLFFMKRCGFDTFALREDQVLEDAIAAFSTFTNPYQNDVQDQRPLFRRRQG